MFEALLSNRTVSVLVEALPRILTAGLTMTIPLTLLSFFFAMIIAVAVALVQYANVPVLRQYAGQLEYCPFHQCRFLVNRGFYHVDYCRDGIYRFNQQFCALFPEFVFYQSGVFWSNWCACFLCGTLLFL